MSYCSKASFKMYFKKIAHPCLFIFVLNVLGGEKNTSSLFLTVPLGFCLGATVMKLSLGLKGEVNSCMYCPFIFNLFLNLHTCVLWDGVGQWLVLRCELWSGVQGVWVHAVPCTRTAGKQELNIQSCFMSCLFGDWVLRPKAMVNEGWCSAWEYLFSS